MPERLRVGVLASGRGSNFRALAEAAAAGLVPATLVVLISDRSSAPALDIARANRIEAVVVDPKHHPSREAHEKAVIGALEERGVGLVCLAGYMRLLSGAFVGHYSGRLLNIHPSLLPAFPGLHPHRQTLEHGVKVSGATVHFVDEGVDTGPIILQEPLELPYAADISGVQTRLHEIEHRLLPKAIRLIARGAVRMDPDNPRRVLIDDGDA